MEALEQAGFGTDLTPVEHPVFQIEMAGRQVTADLTPFILRVSYSDYEEDQSDTIDVTVEDTDGRFRGAWYPTMGDRVRLKMGYAGQPLLDCGEFEIDEIELAGPPDTVTIRALAAGVSRPQRTHQGRAYDNTTLAAIAQRVAKRLKLSVVGKIEPIKITRVSQIHENDLTFMRRVAADYGYAFSVKGSQMVFYKLAELHQAKAVTVIRRTDMTRYSYRDKLKGVVKQATVTYLNPKTKRKVSHTVRDTRMTASSDTLKLNSRVESEEQAKAKAEAAIARQNLEGTVATLQLPGNPKLVAGVNFTMADMGALSGDYHVVMSRHEIERGGGYYTEVEAKRVRPPQQKTSKKQPAKQPLQKKTTTRN
ncbi:hypothetical protein EV683_1294 [Crenobacter luteus]|uniref:phage late control D family protein n=1 Tax=Crenobacter luteus TaxID=1452487 RepID=UPI001051B33C|nr:contractile injection system protein, VgrG/Pvc8 family [Crenobacter luteus]TCP09234.1 hypothetical protein EV683_1294 [Crenobacter luteus]